MQKVLPPPRAREHTDEKRREDSTSVGSMITRGLEKELCI
ncbi:hypothetical protein OOU_Y34scaffold00228g33 [Pyricularia oryzae Y34]|uniref:Uncharacterized protein n=2 Tax=Pyricularia oryzae TaxID=318829 RepID=A0AA97PPI8_PYRO3|nr:hypothetical protein OOU_Y34scaffold00228g33 [Pyricularia oryzae Y34]